MDSLPVPLPLINPNEPEALLAALFVQEGQHVEEGAILCTLETTKSTADVTAGQSGYVVGLRLQAGMTVSAGELLCYLASSQDWTPPKPSSVAQPAATGDNPPPPGLRITQPALALARQHGIDLTTLPQDTLVTESAIRQLVKGSLEKTGLAVPLTSFDAASILIYGGGGHGKMLIDLLRSLGIFRIAGILDDGLRTGTIMGVPVLGGGELLPELHARGLRLAVNAVGGIGIVAVRVKVFQRLAEAGFSFPVLVHPSAVVEESAVLEAGAQVFARAYVGSEARIGFGSIINTGSIVSHDCRLEAYTTISPGAILAGEVRVGEGGLVGMGATINLRVQVGAGARIGNSATVKSDVPTQGVVRAGNIWPE